MLPDHGPIAERTEILKSLYPWFKEEVYRRRQQMIWLTTIAVSTLFVLLFLVPALPPARPTHRALNVFVVTGVLLFAASVIYVIRQQRVRHQMAKRVLINLEQELGLYEKGRYLDDTSLYPQNWQTAWRGDRSEFIYYGSIVLLSALVICALLLR
jgi:protein-S-isoprenylcysteine O-methyltransferase Ste14